MIEEERVLEINSKKAIGNTFHQKFNKASNHFKKVKDVET